MDWVPEPEVLFAPSSCLNIAVSVVTRWRLNDIHCSKMFSLWGTPAEMTCGVFIAATGAFLAEVERSCAVLLRMFLFDCDVRVSSWRRGILSKVVQVSC